MILERTRRIFESNNELLYDFCMVYSLRYTSQEMIAKCLLLPPFSFIPVHSYHHLAFIAIRGSFVAGCNTMVLVATVSRYFKIAKAVVNS